MQKSHPASWFICARQPFYWKANARDFINVLEASGAYNHIIVLQVMTGGGGTNVAEVIRAEDYKPEQEPGPPSIDKLVYDMNMEPYEAATVADLKATINHFNKAIMDLCHAIMGKYEAPEGKA